MFIFYSPYHGILFQVTSQPYPFRKPSGDMFICLVRVGFGGFFFAIGMFPPWLELAA
jgi:hypothetical protein